MAVRAPLPALPERWLQVRGHNARTFLDDVFLAHQPPFGVHPRRMDGWRVVASAVRSDETGLTTRLP
jgi:hypothetical protein